MKYICEDLLISFFCERCALRCNC